MTNTSLETSEHDEVAKAMRLRPEPPKVMRLSRKALLTGGCVVAICTAAVLAFALRAPTKPVPPQELYRPATTVSSTVGDLPKDYTGPRLGPPLPGDLGRPILAAGQEQEWARTQDPATPSSIQSAQADAAQAAQQRREQARATQEAALTSGLFAPSSSRSTASATRDGGSSAEDPAPDEAPSASADLWPGTIITAALITGLRSDLPGPVLGQVAEDVLDSRTGRTVVIPRGSRLIGVAESEVAYGQSRLRIVWTRLVTPQGRIVDLAGAEASDPSGYAGLEDQIDNRWGERLRAAGLTTLLSISAAATEGDDEDRIVRALRDGSGRAVDQVGRGVLDRSLSVPPRLTVRPGYAFRIILTESLSLPSQGD